MVKVNNLNDAEITDEEVLNYIADCEAEDKEVDDYLELLERYNNNLSTMEKVNDDEITDEEVLNYIAECEAELEEDDILIKQIEVYKPIYDVVMIELKTISRKYKLAVFNAKRKLNKPVKKEIKDPEKVFKKSLLKMFDIAIKKRGFN